MMDSVDATTILTITGCPVLSDRSMRDTIAVAAIIHMLSIAALTILVDTPGFLTRVWDISLQD